MERKLECIREQCTLIGTLASKLPVIAAVIHTEEDALGHNNVVLTTLTG